MKIFILFFIFIFCLNISAKPIPIEIKKKDNDFLVISPEKIEEKTYYLFNEDDMNETLTYMEALTKPIIIPKTDDTKWYIITSILGTSLLLTSGYIYFKEMK